MLIRHIKTGEIREIELIEFKTSRYSYDWEEVPDEPTAGVASVVPGKDSPPPLKVEVDLP